MVRHNGIAVICRLSKVLGGCGCLQLTDGLADERVAWRPGISLGATKRASTAPVNSLGTPSKFGTGLRLREFHMDGPYAGERS